MGENVFSNLHFYTSIKFYIIYLVNLLDTNSAENLKV